MEVLCPDHREERSDDYDIDKSKRIEEKFHPCFCRRAIVVYLRSFPKSVHEFCEKYAEYREVNSEKHVL
jgi:hypothetical protein